MHARKAAGRAPELGVDPVYCCVPIRAGDLSVRPFRSILPPGLFDSCLLPDSNAACGGCIAAGVCPHVYKMFIAFSFPIA